MTEVSFNEIKPFVRYSRELDKDIYKHGHLICAYDSRLLYCTGGQGKITVDGKDYSVKSGMLFIWKGGIPYKYVIQENRDMKFIALNFDFMYDKSDLSVPIPPYKADCFIKEQMTENFSFCDCPIFNSPVIISDGSAFHSKLIEINREFTYKKGFYRLRMSALLAEILCDIVSFFSDTSSQGNKTVDSIISYMKQNLSDNLSNDLLGKIFKYHPNYINQLFVLHTGKSVHKYLSDLRLTKSMELLQGTNLSLEEICIMCGYGTLPHFSKAFKKKTGYPPSAFRLM